MDTSQFGQNRPITRRDFLDRSALAGAGFYAAMATRRANADAEKPAKDAPSEKLIVGVVGTSRNAKGGNGRGCELAVSFASLAGAEVAYVCDVDERNLAPAIAAVEKKQNKAPKGVADFRTILDDKALDAIVIATPDHWHTPVALLAMSAGKHVYVEKPCCHNAQEGQWLVAAARKHNRLVQHGTQRRSWPALREGIARMQAGEIGRVILARSWYMADRPTIGHGKPAPVPSWLDYSLWQGPAPERPYRDNLVHYNWHWFWHWGTGELGNNGVHTIDLCRWGLGVDCPIRVSSTGGKYRYDDDQETPDTNVAVFDFGGATITWESRSWSPHTPNDPPYDTAFYGEKGTLLIAGASYRMCDLAGKEIAKGSGSGSNDVHTQNFVDAIRGNAKLNAEIEEGVKSALLCHLGNISYRVNRTLHIGTKGSATIFDDKEATALWGREYRKGWEPVV